MKSYLIRPAGALVLALSLASCGGGDDDKFTVEGYVSGLQYPGLVLQNNGGQDLTVAPPATAGEAVKFVFPNKIEYGDTYKVTVKTNPAHQVCDVSSEAPYSNADTAGRLAAIDVRMACEVSKHAIGGTITGLTKDNTGLVLANGPGATFTPVETALTAATPFKYALGQVAYNDTYGVVVVTQPVGRFCTVSNAAGVMGDVDIDNINVNCVPV